MANDFYSPVIIKTHYAAFKEFLESPDNDSKRQIGAKEKLIKLTNQQFQELSTDVYDELIRRTYNARDTECLQSQSEFLPKRNEARQKLAALSPTRYRDLSQDIYNEIQRRFPEIVVEVENEKKENGFSPNGKMMDAPNDSRQRLRGDSPNEPLSRSRSRSRSLQSGFPPQNNIKSQQTPNQKINFAPLDDVMANLAKELAYKNDNENVAPVTSDGVDLEVAELRKANINLKSKFDSLTEKYSTEKNRLEKELESIQETLTNRVKINEEQATEYSKLYNNYTQLQTDIKTLRSQSEVNEKITDELRQENDNQIEKINELTKKNEQLENENKSLKEEIEKLKEELKKEKEKKPEVIEKIVEVASPPHSETKTEEVKQESPRKESDQSKKEENNSQAQPAHNPIDDLKPTIKDCINPERFNNYREAVNELLNASKSENPADVLVAMKSIVITCKNITEESDEYERLNENTFTIEEQDKLIEIKDNLSVALTNLMNVTKNHATNYPDVSSSFIESATSDLSVTIVSLVRTLKEHQNRLLNISPLQGQAPPVNKGENIQNIEQVQELKHFLEEKTDLIVQGIQSLLKKIQEPCASSEEFTNAIGHVTGIVENVITASQNTFSSQAGSHLSNSGEPIIQGLKMGNNRLKEIGASMQNKSEQEIKTLKQSLTSPSYEIAVFVRDLLELLEEKNEMK